MISMSKKAWVWITAISLLAVAGVFFTTGCGPYKFADVSLPDSIKTVKVNYIENRASYVNPQLSPTLTDKLRQKIVSQTKLTQVNADIADYNISGAITNYSVSTAGISQQQAATNRLTVTVSISITDKNNLPVKDKENISISRTFDFSATLTLQQAEAAINDEMIRNLTDEIFNRIFSDW